MLKLAEYLQYATECRELARTTASPDHAHSFKTWPSLGKALQSCESKRLSRKADFDADDD